MRHCEHSGSADGEYDGKKVDITPPKQKRLKYKRRK